MNNNYLLNNLLDTLPYVLFEDYSPESIIKQTKIETKDDGYYVYVSVPGLTKDDLKLIVKDNYLTILHEKEQEKKTKFSFVNNFEKNYKLPKDADVDKIRASVSNGVCTIKIPKDKARSTEKLITIS